MSVSLAYKAEVGVTEVLSTNVPAGTDKTVTHTGYNTTKTLNGTSSPPATKVAAFEQALTGGAATIDLSALVGTNGATVVGTGLRVQAVKFRGKSDNANPITVAKGASNGYDGFGASFSITLDPGAEVTILPDDAGSDIGSGNKNLDVSGTGTQVLECIIVLG